jgi:signal transduction histidine kinase
LQTTLAPRRELVIRVSDELQALNRASFVQQRDAIASLYGVTQRSIWVSFGLALAASFGIAVLATLYTGRLEQRIRAQRELAAQYAADLQKLSAKLITAQEEERRTIARELHDEVGQVLTTIKVELSIAQNAIAAGGGRPDILENARSITDGAVQSVRDLSHLLHPALLDDLGLPEAVQWYLRGYGKRHAIRTELDHHGLDSRLPSDVETAAYRIIQEALTNIAKHAHATRCRVSLERLPGTVRVVVDDDGVGFDPAEAYGSNPRRGGLGLLGIRERAMQLRGVVQLDTAPGRGTRLTVELPTGRGVFDAPAGPAAVADRSIALAPGVTRA